MPDELTAKVIGVFTGVTPPYVWTLDQAEVVVLLDGLETLMLTFQTALEDPDHVNQEMYNALVGSYTYVKMTRQRLLNMSPDIKEEGIRE